MSDSRSLSPPQSPAALFAYGLLLTGATAAMVLAGFASQGNLGVFLLFAGIALIFCPPTVSVDTRWWLGGGLLVACCTGAFLPARFLPSQPNWRHVLDGTAGIHLPSMISPAPQETSFWLALLLLTVIIGLFTLAQPIRSRSLVYLMLGAVLVCGVYAASAVSAKLAGWIPPLVQNPSFGFFPNRNHTAMLLVTGSILSLSLLNVAFLFRRWIILDLSLAALVPCSVALLFFCGSRAGIIFFFIGAAFWLAGLGSKYPRRRFFVAVHIALLLAAGGLFLVFPSTGRDRLLVSMGFTTSAQVQSVSTPAPVALTSVSSTRPVEPPSEARIQIWRDTLEMIADAPLMGTGLGTFKLVFPQYRQHSCNNARALHPESDWLLLIAEAGLPAFVCVCGLGVGLAKRLAAGRTHPYWPLRWGCGAAALTALLHGAVDVPTHRAALGWWILVLVGLSLSLVPVSPNDRLTHVSGTLRSRWSWQRFVFMMAGVGALTLGGMLTAAEWFGGPALPPFMVEQAPFKIFDLQNHKNFAAAAALARQVVKGSPMFDQPYFHLGVALASQSDDEGTDAKVDECFRAQRLLDPSTSSVPILQGNTWGGYDPVRVAAMYLDSVARQARVDRLDGRSPTQTIHYYGSLVARLDTQPDAQRYLLAASRPDVRFAQEWLANVGPQLAKEQAYNISQDDAWFRSLNDADRQNLTTNWFARKEQDQPQSLLPDGRAAGPGAWPVRLRQMVNGGHFERAVGELSRRYGISLDLPGTSASPDSTAPPQDDVVSAVQAALTGGDLAKARRLLNEAGPNAGDPASLERLRWQAALAAHDADWYPAWLALEQYVRRTRQTEWP